MPMPQFHPIITLGNIITLVLMAGSALVAWGSFASVQSDTAVRTTQISADLRQLTHEFNDHRETDAAVLGAVRTHLESVAQTQQTILQSAVVLRDSVATERERLGFLYDQEVIRRPAQRSHQ